MATTIEDVADYVGSSPAEPLLPLIHRTSLALIDRYLGPRGKAKVPVDIYDNATLHLASELFARRNAPGGIASWASGEVPVRLARDPMLSVIPMLAPFKGLGAVG